MHRRATFCALRCSVLLCIGMLLGGCGLFHKAEAPTEPVASPSQDIRREAESTAKQLRGSAVPYAVSFVVRGGERSGLTPADSAALEEAMRGASQLLSLLAEPPDSRVGLERRVIADADTAEKLMQSYGYYRSRTRYEMNWNASPVEVRILMFPGRRFSVSASTVRYESPTNPPMPEKGEQRLHAAPKSLAGFGFAENAPAEAATVMSAVEAVPDWLRQQGFPFASIQKTRYLLYPSRYALEPEITVQTGSYFRFGSLDVQGAEGIDRTYLQRLTPWREGWRWRADWLETYASELQQTGLFREVQVTPGDPATAKDGLLPVRVTLRQGPLRQLSGGVKYATDDGFGVQGMWEHRNFFGAGEQLRVLAPVTQEKKGLEAHFSKPAFGHKNQKFVSSSSIMNYTAKGYDMNALSADAGLDRRFSRRWWGGVRAAVQVGNMRENEQGWERFYLFGVPMSARYDGSNNLLNPTSGVRMQATATPWVGMYRGSTFSLLKNEVAASAYYAPLKRPDGSPSDWLVFAARATVGGMFGTTGRNVGDIPGSLRFYTGGGGSVRGYAYQGIGPRNAANDPQGGLSVVNISGEMRFKITESFGLVPFIDGGMVYDSLFPKIDEQLRWGAGLGFRYYTPIGPLRLDLAMPLNPRHERRGVHMYISIGQAF